MDYIIVSLLQLAFSGLKVFEIKYSYERAVVKLTIVSLIQSAAWILSTAIGIAGILNGDMGMVIIYVIFGGLGKVVAIKLSEIKAIKG